MSLMQLGMPPPQPGAPPVTNVRNTEKPFWQKWLKPPNRCLVPFNSFSKYAPEPDPVTKRKDIVWFALADDRPLTAFAGICTDFKGDRGPKSKPVPGPHLVYGFLTTEPRRGRVYPSQGHARNPDDGRTEGRLAARPMG